MIHNVNDRLRGTIDQPYGFPQLDKDRKIDTERLKTDEVNGIAALDAAGNLLVKGSSLFVTANGAGDIIIRERTTDEGVLFLKRDGVDDYRIKIIHGGVHDQIQVKSDRDVANGIAGLDASAKIEQAQIPNLEIHSQTPQILTGAGAIDVTSMITHLVTGGAGADALTLPDGAEGQEKIILIKTLSVGGDTSVITPTNLAHGTTITGNAAGSIQNLLFSNGAWHWTGGYGVVIA